MKNSSFDDIDLKIIKVLQEDAQTPYTEVAKKVFVSPATIHVRMKKLQDAGIVIGSALKVDYTKLGFDMKAFLGIFLEKSSVYDSVLKELSAITEITNIDYTTGNYSMFLKIRCKDTNHLREILHEKIQRIEGISRTETIISLHEDIDRELDLLQ